MLSVKTFSIDFILNVLCKQNIQNRCVPCLACFERHINKRHSHNRLAVYDYRGFMAKNKQAHILLVINTRLRGAQIYCISFSFILL